jgi:hypothetical protein
MWIFNDTNTKQNDIVKASSSVDFWLLKSAKEKWEMAPKSAETLCEKNSDLNTNVSCRIMMIRQIINEIFVH